ncbi:hypothetical protein TcBrA4_0007960 [Trypanosoma cruzi]|nr:hypothetical protein TcBrA4_0007960 [Trypanosoma cruzi]
MVAETQRQMMQQGCTVPNEVPPSPEGFGNMGGPNSGWGPCRQRGGSVEPAPAGHFGGFSPAPQFLPNDLEKCASRRSATETTEEPSAEAHREVGACRRRG